LVIEYRDLEPPKTGIFDGLRIVIDPDVAFEMQCFLLLHLVPNSIGHQRTAGEAPVFRCEIDTGIRTRSGWCRMRPIKGIK